ncbi:transmembrane protein 106B-like [Ruditapes philippinarum]|uniref:transmembrane protein 106B-like n=1 Tax=Ruditapes philippinarum TaxID=129788 RepID=UPI00295AA627|nr:transmembrane protein 106B-like [Ruditapes philippinarum]
MRTTVSTGQNGMLRGQQSSEGYGSFESVVVNHEDSDDDAGSVYTELLQGSVPCPSCKGMGKIPKEQEGQLVALIPMKDKRLRPRRTYLWVCLAVVVCLTAAGLLMFFMFPRGVDMTSKKPYLSPVGAVYINVTQQYVNFTIQNRFNISNQNFLPIKITSVAMTVLYDTQVLAESKNMSKLDVPMRSSGQYYVTANVTLDQENQMGYMAQSCDSPIRWAHELVMLFEFNCNYEVLGRTEQTTLQTFQFVSCYSPIRPSPIGPTVKPSTTTTTKTTTTNATTTS